MSEEYTLEDQRIYRLKIMKDHLDKLAADTDLFSKVVELLVFMEARANNSHNPQFEEMFNIWLDTGDLDVLTNGLCVPREVDSFRYSGSILRILNDTWKYTRRHASSEAKRRDNVGNPSSADVAEYILETSGEMSITKLQALTYYCQCWYGAFYGLPMFYDSLFANGSEEYPAYSSELWDKSRTSKRGNLLYLDKMSTVEADSLEVDLEMSETIAKVIAFYGKMDETQLKDLILYEGLHLKERGEDVVKEVSLEDIKEYYENLSGPDSNEICYTWSTDVTEPEKGKMHFRQTQNALSAKFTPFLPHTPPMFKPPSTNWDEKPKQAEEECAFDIFLRNNPEERGKPLLLSCTCRKCSPSM